ncbi:PLC-like phosphodiesterase [Mycena filopes]|nr:PLC-like phosphodiesterase [Mycena filopes]
MTFLYLPLLALALPALTAVTSASQQFLANAALADILARGSPILGFDTGCLRTSQTCDWMRNYPDGTKLVHMNLPGTHDSATWNYTQATQDSLFRYTGTDVPPAAIFQCQDKSLFDMLNLRHSGSALLAPTTTVEDVWFGLYHWLEQHPTEAVLISLNYEGGTGTPRDLKLEQHIYDIMSSDVASHYWVQTNGSRGKLTFLQRYEYDFLPASESKRIGIPLSPSAWTDNSPLHHNPFIEDYYEIGLPIGAGAAENIQWKYNATTAHLLNATTQNPDQLYITFASSEHDDDVPPETPRIQALGNGSDTPGVNQKLLPWLQERKGKRFGIIMLDFFDSVPGLVEAVIGL